MLRTSFGPSRSLCCRFTTDMFITCVFIANMFMMLNISVHASEVIDYQLKESAPYSPTLFTQGYVIEGSVVYVSSGLYGKSFVERLDRQTGSVLRYPLEDHHFAEGITVLGNYVYVLTWKAQTLIVLNKHTLAPVATKAYYGQGWGLTHNDNQLIMSNGTNEISFRDPHTFAIERTIKVNGLKLINELEFIDGIIWANRWYQAKVFLIDPADGCLLATIDISPLMQGLNKHQVANGIALDTVNNGIWLTGKQWTKQFLIAKPDTSQLRCL